MSCAKNIHAGGDFDDFLKEDGIFKEVEARALKRALALQVHEPKAEVRTDARDAAPRGRSFESDSRS